MGGNGAGGVDLGNGGAGFNPAAMMAGMAVGGAVGQNMAGIMNNAMNPNPVSQNNVTPPPIPTAAYHVAVNGQATGPYNLQVLRQMTGTGQLTTDSLVWKVGMAAWTKAGETDELKALFAPPVPPVE